MVLEPMPPDDVVATVSDLYEDQRRRIAVVLTDGAALAGQLPMKAVAMEETETGTESWDVPASGACFVNGALVLLAGGDKAVLVPVEEIAGVTHLNYREGMRQPVGKDTPRKAAGRGYPVEDAQYGQFSHPIDTFDLEPSDKMFLDDTPLYCDWGFLSKNAGGINQLGANLGAGVSAGVSVGWDESLSSTFWTKVARRETPINTVCQASEEAVVSGFITFLTEPGSDGLRTETMEGDTWFTGVLTEHRLSDRADLDSSQWSIAYFRDGSFMEPRTRWEDFTQPIRVYAEIVPLAFETDFGHVDCCLKARAAAFLAEEPSYGWPSILRRKLSSYWSKITTATR